MLRLMKLLAFGLFGYALYQFILGVTQSEGGFGGSSGGGMMSQGQGGGGQRSRQRDDRGRFLSGGQGGGGQAVETMESDGGMSRQTVGRGVIS